MTKEEIIKAIKHTVAANGGVPLGRKQFENETEIGRADWEGIHWARWGDALKDAGFAPNKPTTAFDENAVLFKYAEYALELRNLPTESELRLKRRKDKSFPDKGVFRRWGTKKELIKKLLQFCRSHDRFNEVVNYCQNYFQTNTSAQELGESSTDNATVGYVYLIKHGSRSEYKIGRTNNPLRREGEIGVELPAEINPLHKIKTDDPAGVEGYWHRRFAKKRLNGEWFSLTADDVRAFKRWKRIC